MQISAKRSFASAVEIVVSVEMEAKDVILPPAVEKSIVDTEQRILEKGVFKENIQYVLTSSEDIIAKIALMLELTSDKQHEDTIPKERKDAVIRWMGCSDPLKCYMITFFDTDLNRVSGVSVFLRLCNGMPAGRFYNIDGFDERPSPLKAELKANESGPAGPSDDSKYVNFAFEKIKSRDTIGYIEGEFGDEYGSRIVKAAHLTNMIVATHEMMFF